MINSPNSSCIVCGLFPEGEWLLFVRELDKDGIPLTPFHLPYKTERSRNKFHPWFLNEVVRDYGKLDFPEGQAKVFCLKLTEEAKESPFEKIMLFREKDLKRHYLDPLSRHVAKRYFALTPNPLPLQKADIALPLYQERLDMVEYFFHQGRIPTADYRAFRELVRQKASMDAIKKASDYLLETWNLDREEYRDHLFYARAKR